MESRQHRPAAEVDDLRLGPAICLGACVAAGVHDPAGTHGDGLDMSAVDGEWVDPRVQQDEVRRIQPGAREERRRHEHGTEEVDTHRCPRS
jgi:hypothetical protein